MATNKVKPAFPGRASAMGYEPGLTKLEWLVAHLVAFKGCDVEQAIAIAEQIIAACAKAEAND